MPFLLCTLPFGGFSGQHIFHQFRQQTFFLTTFSTISFFLAPPPRYQMVRPSDGLVCQPDSFPFQLDRSAYSIVMQGHHVALN